MIRDAIGVRPVMDWDQIFDSSHRDKLIQKIEDTISHANNFGDIADGLYHWLQDPEPSSIFVVFVSDDKHNFLRLSDKAPSAHYLINEINIFIIKH